jgi:hypothetical protein
VNTTQTLPEGLHRDAPSLLHFFGGPNWTVDPSSPAADAIRGTQQYEDALREGIAWSKAVEATEAKAAGRPINPDAVCEPACDIFALNATANGWVIGEKITAASDNYTPQVADNQRDHLSGQPLDVHSLAAEQPAQTDAGAPWRRAQEVRHEPEAEAPSRGIDPA